MLNFGTRLGAYEIVSSLGMGGMGEVYRARDGKLNRDVALKVLPASFADDADRLARFRREAQLLAALNHPNIAHIYGLEGEAVSFIVMELVEGEDLSQRLARGPIPLDEAIPIAKQVADALEAAHEQGIIHRDLKPANVKLRPDGTVKVLDFGLAKALDPSASSASAAALANSPTLTSPAAITGISVILGTAAYMAPEQAKGKRVDRRADIWAFGCLLYEMLAGRRAFDAEDVSETLAAVLTRSVDIAALPEGTPLRLRTLVRDCLVRDPKQRLRDIGEARRAIEQLMSGAVDEAALPAAHTSSSGWRRALPWAIAAAGVLAAAGVTWQHLRAPVARPGPVTRSKVELKDLSGFVDVSRDGTRLVYTSNGGQSGLYLSLRQLDQFESRPIPGTDDNVGFPVFSPDGQWVAYSSGNVRVKKIAVTGGTPITLCDGSLANGAAWGDDDTIVFSGPKGLLRVPAAGGTPQALTTIDSGKGEAAHVRPQFLPGGRQILFTVSAKATDTAQFAVLDLDKGGYRTIAKGGDNGRYAPSGHLTYARQGTLFAVPFDLRRFTTAGAEVPVVEGVSPIGPGGTADYTFSDDGLLVYSESFAQQGFALAWLDRTGARQPASSVEPRPWSVTDTKLSPDVRRVAGGIRNQQGGIDLWILDLQRGTFQRLTSDGEINSPVWTPDGRQVFYGSTRDGKSAIHAIPADGSARAELVLATDGVPSPTSFTPDGRTLLYTLSARILALPLTGGGAGQPRPLHEASFREYHAQVSPDGRWVAYASLETGTWQIYVQPFPGPGSKVPVSTRSGRDARWVRNGRELVYWSLFGDVSIMSVAIPSSPAQPSPPQELFKPPGMALDVTPDGSRFLIGVNQREGVVSVFATVTNWFEELRRRAPARK
jgi:Tol biopolymer transport system component